MAGRGLHRFSLRELVRQESAGHLLEQAELRCLRQLRLLAPLPRLRQTSVLRGMYEDSLQLLAGMRRLAARDADLRLSSLCARHGLFVESLAELCELHGYGGAVSEGAEPLLATHCSLSALLEQASSLSGSGQGRFVRQVRLPELCLSARDSAKSLAEHSEGCCPEIEVEAAEDLALLAIPSRVKFALVEVLKNAVSSTLRRHRSGLPSTDEPALDLPPVRVRLRRAEAAAEVSVEDQGSGVAAEELARVGEFVRSPRLSARY